MLILEEYEHTRNMNNEVMAAYISNLTNFPQILCCQFSAEQSLTRHGKYMVDINL
jgi:hypothetical protein